MRPWNPHGQTFHGAPIINVVPTGMLVYGPPLSPVAAAMAQAAFVSFCGRARLSLVQNLQEHGVLPDGSRFMISVIAGQARMTVWTSRAAPEAIKYRSGFSFFEVVDGAVGDQRFIIDVGLAGGAHTSKWKVERMSVTEFDKLTSFAMPDVIRPSIRGASGLPYSVIGYTFGVKLFDVDAISAATGRFEYLLAFAAGKAYSLAPVDTAGKVELVCSIAKLGGEVGVGKPPPTITEMSSTVVTELESYSGASFDWSFVGDRVVAGVPNPQYAPELVVDLSRRLVYLENPGLGYSGSYSITLRELGEEFAGPKKHKVFRRSGDSFVLEETLDLPAPEIIPPTAAFSLSAYSPMPKPWNAFPLPGKRINAAYVGDDLLRGYWTLTGLEFHPDGLFPYVGSWWGDIVVQDQWAGSGQGSYSHDKYSHAKDPQFDSGTTLVKNIQRSQYDYTVDVTSSMKHFTTGRYAGPSVATSEQNQHIPPPSGTFDSFGGMPPVWSGVVTTTGTRTVIEDSSSLITHDLEGRSGTFTLHESSAWVKSVLTVDEYMESLGFGGPNSHYNHNSTTEVRSKFLTRDVLVHDPYLGLLCYFELESTLEYSIDYVYSVLAPETTSVSGQSSVSAAPKYSDVAVLKSRLVIEQNGVVREVIEVPAATASSVYADRHYLLDKFGFGAPAKSAVIPQSIQLIPRPSVPYAVNVGRGVFTIVDFHATAESTGLSGLGYAKFWKSPATGAMILETYAAGTGVTHFTVDKTGVRRLTDTLSSIEIPGSGFNERVI